MTDATPPEGGSRRMETLAFVAFALFAALVARLWFLQIMQAPSFEQEARANNTREIFTEAPRGQILDVNGTVLAGRQESLVVVLDWTALRDLDSDERAVVYEQVASELNGAGIKTKVEGLERRYQAAQNGSLKPVIIAEDVGEKVWVLFSERDLPGFRVERRWIRTYPYGPIGSHIIGYTGTVSDQQRADELNAANGDKIYFPGDEIGLAGIERLFENRLRGVPEIRRVEIDANNRVIGTVEVLQPAVPGEDLVLTVDIDLQHAAEQILADELRLARAREACKGCIPHVADAGSLVALDVNDGSVVAMASLPTYDPSDFIFGIGAEQFAYLQNRPDQPFLDRSTQGLYPAGSTFKPVVAHAAMTSHARTEWEVWQDEGVHLLSACNDTTGGAGCRFQNAGGVALGPVDMRRALEVSSDTYFYSLGELFWVEQDSFGETIMQDTATEFGFGDPSGIQLPSEKAGRVPTPENRREEFGEDERWFTGDNVNLSIGQGDLLVTPLQLSNAYAMLATGGTRYQPRLVDRIEPVGIDGEVQEFLPRVSRDEPLEPTSLNAIRDGLLRVPRTGTASEAFLGFPLENYPIAGKTGTIEVRRKADYAAFVGYGPWPNPEYSVAAVLEQSGFGGDAAAPAVRRFFDLLAGNEPIPPAPLSGEDGEAPVRPTIAEAAGQPDESEQADPAETATPSSANPSTTTVPAPTEPESEPDATQPPSSSVTTVEPPQTTTAPSSTTEPPSTSTPTVGDGTNDESLPVDDAEGGDAEQQAQAAAEIHLAPGLMLQFLTGVDQSGESELMSAPHPGIPL